MIKAFFDLQHQQRRLAVRRLRTSTPRSIGARARADGAPSRTSRRRPDIEVVRVAIVSPENAERGGHSVRFVEKGVAMGKSARSRALRTARPCGSSASRDRCRADTGARSVAPRAFEPVEVKNTVFQEIEDIVEPEAPSWLQHLTCPSRCFANGEASGRLHRNPLLSPVDKMPLVRSSRVRRPRMRCWPRSSTTLQIRRPGSSSTTAVGFFTSRVIGTFINRGSRGCR